eukprot:s1987_g5.t1
MQIGWANRCAYQLVSDFLVSATSQGDAGDVFGPSGAPEDLLAKGVGSQLRSFLQYIRKFLSKQLAPCTHAFPLRGPLDSFIARGDVDEVTLSWCCLAVYMPAKLFCQGCFSFPPALSEGNYFVGPIVDRLCRNVEKESSDYFMVCIEKRLTHQPCLSRRQKRRRYEDLHWCNVHINAVLSGARRRRRQDKHVDDVLAEYEAIAAREAKDAAHSSGSP